VLGLCLRFVGSDSELRNLILLNKESHLRIKSAVYKQALLVSQPERLPFKRKYLWDCVLSLTSNQCAYQAFK
jgi:hypothetical protein